MLLRPLAALARTAPRCARRYSTDRPLVTLTRLSDSPLAAASRQAVSPAPGAPDARAAAYEPELDGGISLLTLDRAPARNAISMQLLAELEECVEAARGDGTRVLVIRSLVPSTFCAGADLRERKGMTPAQVDTFLLALRRTLSSIERLPFPCLAALDGTALGGGLELALCADVRIAGPGARLGLTETRLGIIPGAGGTHRLTRLVGPARAKDLIFSARILDGQTAHALGVVEHYAPAYNGGEGGDEALMAAVASARQMAGNGPLALKAAKLAIDRGEGMDTETALDWERACYDRLMGTQDRLEGLRAFAEKRRPRYTGE